MESTGALPSSAGSYSPNERRVLFVSMIGHFFTHMSVLIFPTVALPYAREAGLGLAEVIPLGFMMYFLYGALAIPAGAIADKWSRYKTLLISLFGIGFFALMAGLAPVGPLFVVALAGIGFACSLYHPAGLGAIARLVKTQGRAHGLNGVIGSVGLGAAPLLAGGVMFFLNWRWVYIIVGVAALIGAGTQLALRFDESSGADAIAPARKSGSETDRLHNWRYFAIMSMAMLIAGLSYRANVTIAPAHFETELGAMIARMAGLGAPGSDKISGVANLLVGSLFFFGATGQYIGGMIADRHDLRVSYFLFCAMAFPCFGWLWLAHGAAAIYSGLGVTLFFTLGSQSIENTLLSKLIPARLLSTAYGIKFTLTFGVGALATYQVAFIERLFSLRDVYFALALQSSLVALTALWLYLASRSVQARLVSH